MSDHGFRDPDQVRRQYQDAQYQPSLDRRQAPSRKRPRSGMATGIIVIIVTAALFVFVLLRGLLSTTSGLQRASVPGAAVLELSRPGDYTVFLEYKSVMGRSHSALGPDLSRMEIEITSVDSGRAVEIMPATYSSNYSMGGTAGYSVFVFTVETPGSYELSGRYPDGDGPAGVLAVGEGFTRRLLYTIFGSMAVMFVGLPLGIILTLRAAFRRARET